MLRMKKMSAASGENARICHENRTLDNALRIRELNRFERIQHSTRSGPFRAEAVTRCFRGFSQFFQTVDKRLCHTVKAVMRPERMAA